MTVRLDGFFHQCLWCARIIPIDDDCCGDDCRSKMNAFLGR